MQEEVQISMSDADFKKESRRTDYHEKSLLKNSYLQNKRLNKFCRALPAITLYSVLFSILFFTVVSICTALTIINILTLLNFLFLCYVGIFSTKSISKINEVLKVSSFQDKFMMEEESIRRELEASSVEFLNFNSIQHYIVIATYNESKELIGNTLENIAISPIAKKQINIIIACEMRSKNGKINGEMLTEEFKERFNSIKFTLHPPGLEGEIPGKASNVHWALRELDDNKELDNTIITIADSDSFFTINHFEYLTYRYITQKDRYNCIFQAPMVLFSNYLDCPVPTKLVAIGSTLHEIACMSDTVSEHINFSTYSFSLNLLRRMGGYSERDIIAEDWRFFFKAYFETKGESKVTSLFIPILATSVVSDGYIRSIYDRFQQAKRHSWGIIELTYFLSRLFHSILYGAIEDKPKHSNRTLKILFKTARVHFISGISFVLMVYPLIFTVTKHFNFFNTQPCSSLNFLVWLMGFLNFITLFPALLLLKNAFSALKWVYPKLNPLKFLVHVILIILITAPVQFLLVCFPTFWAVTRMAFTDKFKYITAAKPKEVKQEIN